MLQQKRVDGEAESDNNEFPESWYFRKDQIMGDGKSFLDKIFGKEDKKKEEKKKSAKKPSPDNEFGEEEKTFDGVVRQLKVDLEEEAIEKKEKKKKK
jgi:hypothetical protein